MGTEGKLLFQKLLIFPVNCVEGPGVAPGHPQMRRDIIVSVSGLVDLVATTCTGQAVS